jgi:hypothetical protein
LLGDAESPWAALSACFHHTANRPATHSKLEVTRSSKSETRRRRVFSSFILYPLSFILYPLSFTLYAFILYAFTLYPFSRSHCPVALCSPLAKSAIGQLVQQSSSMKLNKIPAFLENCSERLRLRLPLPSAFQRWLCSSFGQGPIPCYQANRWLCFPKNPRFVGQEPAHFFPFLPFALCLLPFFVSSCPCSDITSTGSPSE